jgi:L-fuculose-phosphate aldolase
VVSDRLRDEVAFACRLMHRLALAPSHASARLPDAPQIVVKARGGDVTTMTRDHVIVVDLDGNVVAGEAQPPAELPLHLAIYRARPDVRAVAHTHQPLATAALDVPGPRADVPRHPYPGLIDAPELGTAMARTLGAAPLVHLHAHGFAIAGADLEEVVALAAGIEDWARHPTA